MKSYTDLEQSKKLVKILPLESADMLFPLKEDKYADSLRIPLTKKHWEKMMMPEINPCWSLAALFDLIPKRIKDYNVLRIDISINDFAIWYDEIDYGVNNDLPNITAKSAVDACVDMIEKLHELNLL